MNQQFNTFNQNEKILPADGGYIQGRATLVDFVNGVADKAHGKVHDSKTDVNAITVDEAKKIELKKLEEGVIISPFWESPSEKGYFLDPGSIYNSYFSGSGWQFAGYKFSNSDYSTNQRGMGWNCWGDTMIVGDLTDAHDQYYYGWSNGYQLPLNGVYNSVKPGDGGIWLTGYSWNPAPGNGYSVIGW